ncbi:MAG: tetratricopeptide repeat protein, partial [Spirochaetales bacterium]
MGIVFADSRPLADGIEAYSAKYSIEPHIPEMLKSIKAASMEYNRQGYALYEQHRYEEAISKFQQAISTDSNNSFAKYNMACSYALMGKENSAKVAGILEAIANNFYQGSGAYWGYWGVQLMVDPDLD